MTCNGATPGTCGPTAPALADATTCTGASACDGAGTCKKADGQSCADASECGGKACVGGACCDGPTCTPHFAWAQPYGSGTEFVWSVGAAPNGGFVTAGQYLTGTSQENVVVTRYDATGTVIAGGGVFGGAKYDSPRGVVVLSDESIVFGGVSNSPARIDSIPRPA